MQGSHGSIYKTTQKGKRGANYPIKSGSTHVTFIHRPSYAAVHKPSVGTTTWIHSAA